jgi:hypothetical protein
VKKVFQFTAALWLALNLMTLTGYPAPWVDEILFADPAIHLAMGKGFVSSAWFNQPSSQFWAGYTPLYSFALAGWLKIFGVSAFAVRSFSLALVTASLVMVWRFLKSIESDSLKWTILIALAVCEPLAFLERAGRPDSMSLFLLAATALVFVEKTWRWRSLMLFLLGALALPSALQYAACAVVVAILVQIWFKPFSRRDIILWASGAVTGAALLAIIYAVHHVLKLFVEVTFASKHSSVGRLLQHLFLGHGESPFVLSDIATASFRDYATPVLLVSSAVVWLLAKRQKMAMACKLASFGVACAVLIPLALQLLGKYPLYYTYMGAVPATIAIVAACGLLTGPARFTQAGILALLLIGGASRFWWHGWNQGTQTVFDPYRHISADDSVVADYPAYYQLINRPSELFAIDYAGGKLLPHFPPDQASRVTKILVHDSRFNEIAEKVGGQWRRVGDIILIRHEAFTQLAIIDDDTRHPKAEKIGIYIRAGGNKN